MKRRIINLAAFSALLPACICCSVKEDRGECPCYVTMDVCKFTDMGFSDATVSYSSSERVLSSEELNLLDYMEEGYTRSVPRRLMRASAVSGLEHSSISSDILSVRKGLSADPVMAYAETFSPESDAYSLKATPHKQYCCISFLFRNRGPEYEYPYLFRIKASCNGLDLYTLKPVEGEYETVVEPNSLGEYGAILPRQNGGTVLLEIFDPYEGSRTEGELLYTINLQRLLDDAGYDWTRTDLDDVSLSVDFSLADVSIEICEWEGDDNYSDIMI